MLFTNDEKKNDSGVVSQFCVALGSNMPSKFGDSLETLRLSLKDLQNLNIKLVAVSNFYETESFPKGLG